MVTVRTQLTHNDRVVLGQSNLFRFVDPKGERMACCCACVMVECSCEHEMLMWCCLLMIVFVSCDASREQTHSGTAISR